MRFPSKKIVERIRREYPVGARVELVRMDDPQAPPIGTLGTVQGVDDTGSLLMRWDNGSHLNVVYGEDIVKRVPLSEPVWLTWKELTEEEQAQARASYISLRADEEEIDASEVDGDSVSGCRFERMPDGYIYVDL